MTEERAHLRAFELANLGAAENVLEVAVGNGKFVSTLAARSRAARCVGVDPSRGMIRSASRRLAREGVASATLCRADALRLPFSAAVFDVLFNCYMLDLMDEGDVPKALAEFRRVLKPSGRLVLLTMAEQSRLLNSIWMGLYRLSAILVGGCRPVAMADFLKASLWRIDSREMISQLGFRSELFIARPPNPGGLR